MSNLINVVLGSETFIPHGHCYLWKPELVWLHLVSDALIALAYYSIPLTLFYFVRKRQGLPFNWVLLLFAIFITACGTTHILEVWTLWHPAYWLSGAFKAGTALVSFYTAIAMIHLVPKALALPSPAQLESANCQLQQEISERQQTEALLQQSEARYRAIMEKQTELVCRFLPDGTLTFINSAYCRYFGKTPEELLQRSYLPIVLEEDLAQSQGRLNKLSQDDSVTTITSQVIRPRGIRTQQWIVQAICNQQGQVVEFQAAGRDITDLKQAEVALQESEERYRSLVTAMAEGIVLHDANGVIQTCNGSAESILGLTLAQMQGRTPIDPSWQTVTEEGEPFPGEQHPATVTLQTGNPCSNVIMGIYKSDRTLTWISINTQPLIRTGEVRPYAVVASFSDITPRKQAELALQQTNQKLSREIAERQQAESALRETEERFQAFMNHNPALCWITNADGQILYTNPTYSQTIKLPDDYIVGESDCSIYPDDIAQQYLHNIRQVAETQQVLEVVESFVKLDGSIGEVLVYKFPIPNRSGQCLVGGVGVDITERNQMEKALQESEERLQLALGASGDGLWDWNIATGHLYYSPRYPEMLGYDAGELAQTLSSWEQLVHPQDMIQVQALVKAHLQDGSIPYQIDYRVQTKQGEWKWINAYGKVMVRDEQGKPLRMVGIARDISDRKQAEEALRQSEAKNRAMLAAIPDLLLRVRRDGTCLDFIQPTHPESGAFVPIGAHISEVLPPDLLQYQLQRMARSLATGELQIWEHQFLKRGKLCDEEVRLVPCGEDEVLIIVRDISDRKQAEKQLELQSIIVRNMAEGICLVRVTDGDIVYTNPKFDHMFGYDPGELTGQHVSIVNYSDAGSMTAQEAAQNIMSEVIQHGEATYEVQNVKKNGTPFWSQATSSIFEHPEYGRVIVAVQQDITEQKQAEEQIKASLKEKEILLKEIHHRVKNNLQIVYSMLRLQWRSLKDPQAAASLLDSQHRIESIALIHEKLYRADNLAEIDFSEYISNLVNNLQSSYNTRPQDISVDTNVASIALSINQAIPCGLIINELVSNSLKYAFSDRIKGHLQIELHTDENFNVTLIVKDDGIGLPKEFNLAQSNSLGLQLVHDFVDQLKGTLKIDDSSGTTFEITFPGSQP